jgi:hypothetical protein
MTREVIGFGSQYYTARLSVDVQSMYVLRHRARDTAIFLIVQLLSKTTHLAFSKSMDVHTWSP